MIDLRVFGTLTLRNSRGEDIQSVLAQPKRAALLAYLAIARPHGFHRRDTLLALLWPEQDEQHARWALNQALRQLRNALGKEVLLSRGDEEVGIAPGHLWCDAAEFAAAVETDDLAKALKLYTGDLLNGFHVSGCGEFERWLEEERSWLRRRATQAASSLAQREEARGELVSAGYWARHASALSPNDEGVARRLIELLGRVGDRAGALQVYGELAQRLREDYEADPAPETSATILAVRERRLATGQAQTPRARAPADDIGPNATEAAVSVPSSPKARRSRRKVSLALGSLLLAGAGAVVWGPSPSSSPTLPGSSNTILVLPFAYQGGPEFAYLGEGMVDLLSANLNGAGEIRTIDPDAVLPQVQRMGRDRLGPEQARLLAARLGAGSYLLGNVVETGGRLRIAARLHSGKRDRGSDQAMVEGRLSQLFQLVDGLTAQLIARQSGSPAGALSRLAALTTDSLSALKAYLEAERHFRAWQLDSTISALGRAIRIDSTFALAHYRLATAIVWTDRQGAGGALDRAQRYSQRLSNRDRQLIEAYAASYHGRFSEAIRIYREIVTRHPDDLEANFQLGDLLTAWGGVLGGSWLDAREPFERVIAIDPNHRDALYHLSTIAARERRLQTLDSLTDHILKVLPPYPGSFYQGQRAVAFGDTAGTTEFLTALRKIGDDWIGQASGGMVAFSTGNLSFGRRSWRLFTEASRSRGVRVLAHLTLAKMELMTGRWSIAQRELDSAEVLDFPTTLEHRALFSLWPLQQVPHRELLTLRDSLLRWKAVAGTSTEGFVTAEHAPAHPYLRLYLLGMLSARLGDYPLALDHAAELEDRAAASFAPTFVAVLGQAVRAEVARGRGRPAEALAILDREGFWTREDVRITGGSPFYAREYEQFTRAELFDIMGRRGEALEAFRGIADGLFHSGAPAHLRMAQIYERQGERKKASTHYARFAELWKDCDPEFRPLVEEARSRITNEQRP
jgi:DNA-binding SARP family transcriptional activator/TolB-like protein